MNPKIPHMFHWCRNLFTRRILRPLLSADIPLVYPNLSELLNTDRLDRHGEELARRHRLKSRCGPDMLLSRLTQNEQILIETQGDLSKGELTGQTISPAGMWLLDNFYLIEEQIRLARLHLPKSYNRQLPRLQSGHPRVYAIIHELISHVDGRVDEENLRVIIESYQRVTSLKLGELWAVPIMLRLALIENLQVIAARIAADRRDRATADYWAARMLLTAEKEPKNTILDLADMARAAIPLSCSFVAELAQKIQSRNSAATFTLAWIEQRLVEQGLTFERQVALDSQQQSVNHVSIRNSITSLRALSSIDWKQFVEAMSRVDGILRNDPAGIYSKMDFATRDAYRHAVEKIARQSKAEEYVVAEKAIGLASENTKGDVRNSHVGYYLVDRKRRILERLMNMRPSARDILARIGTGAPLPLYLAGMVLVAAVITAAAFCVFDCANTTVLWIFGVLLFTGVSQAAMSIVNWLVTVSIPPGVLPKMDFSQGIPPGSSTLVTIPAMLTCAKDAEELVNKMEVSFLANRGNNLFFSILTDFGDGSARTCPGDELLVNLVKSGLRRLNDLYAVNGCRPFMFFHRQRTWNQTEKRWMGYERKRGKLEALNSFLIDGKNSELLVEGDRLRLSNIKYVITLDTDTDLPRDCARRLIETMSHPLNSPVYDFIRKRVVDGYSILQPQVVSSLLRTGESWYTRVFGNDTGIDPYTQAVSDVYQDLFKEGSYIGKGIYDAAFFQLALAQRLPENRVLSHDLLEGAYCRAGLVSDIQLIDEYPENYIDEQKRRHRWIRGDWQIAAWLGTRVPGYKKKSVPNPVSALSKWKIFDNLRRSVIPMVYLWIIVMGWLYITPSWAGIALVSLILFLPVVPEIIHKAVSVPARYPIALHVRTLAGFTGNRIVRFFFSLIVLPYEAINNSSAILQTAWRMTISRGNLLQWIPSKESRLKNNNTMRGHIQLMGCAPVLAAALAGILMMRGQAADTPILLLWFFSPLIVRLAGIRWTVRHPALSGKQREYLNALARKTWRYYETFAGLPDNSLPADNYQEEPREAVAHRTSPTNIGLLLLSNLGAHDIGYICTGRLIDRTRDSFQSMESLVRFRGHFFNWYDTQTLQPLDPLYISTVDSGNLAGYLLTLRAGLSEIKGMPIFRQSFYSGLYDTVSVLIDQLAKPGFAGAKDPPAVSEQVLRLRMLRDTIKETKDRPAGLKAAYTHIQNLLSLIRDIRNPAQEEPESEITWWFDACEKHCNAQLNDLLFLVPWLGSDVPDELMVLEPKTVPGSTVSLDQTVLLLKGLAADLSRNSTGNSIVSMREEKGPELSAVLRRQVRQALHRALERVKQLDALADQCRIFAEQDYAFLYNPSRNLLAIGYDAAKHQRDEGYYDLLASEARLSSFIAIAQGKLPVEHWFALGRLIIIRHGRIILLSWSGSMFEYLMPQLVMPGYDNTLLGQTCTAIIDCQIEYGRRRAVPWGISESGENSTDSHLNYQYRSFGVPGLGFKRDLAADLVVAPYATALALMIKPGESCANMQRMSSKGYEGKYGLYEAIDFTPSRTSRDHGPAVIRSFMAHHQGMSFLSMVNVFTGNLMVRRFESDPLFKATTLLLQERVPRAAPFIFKPSTPFRERDLLSQAHDQLRIFNTAKTPVPEVHLLSNGRYHVMVTNAGGGYSRWHEIAVTRWNEDVTRDNDGQFVYVRDVDTGKYWSTAFAPVYRDPVKYEAVFSQSRAEYRRTDENIETYTEIAVSPEDDIENRRISLRDTSGNARTIELTSFAEVVLAPPASDSAHRAFSNLFVQTEIIPRYHAILCTRRPRSPEESVPWIFHQIVVKGMPQPDISYETDRLAFIGRARTAGNPAAMAKTGHLGGNEGSVLDPVTAIRCELPIDPWGSAAVEFITGAAKSRDEAIALMEKYRDHRFADRVFDMAVIHGKMALLQLNITDADAQLFGRLAGSILYAGRHRRAQQSIIQKNTRGQSNLWAYGISGDLPVVLLRIADPSMIEIAVRLIQAHAYWRKKGLSVDLIIWNEEASGYRQEFRDEILGLITASTEAGLFDRRGGIFLPHPDLMPPEDQILMQAAARIVISDSAGSLTEQILQMPVADRGKLTVPPLAVSRELKPSAPVPQAFRQEDLLFFNGWGGFTRDGKEYLTRLKSEDPTPMPWANVAANKTLGTVISPGGGYTWFENAHEFRLTPWYNDPVSDQSGEAVYIRDEKSGKFWSAAPQPAPGTDGYINRHGFGYSVFEHTQGSLKSDLWIYVDTEAPIKFWMLKLRNDSNTTRRISATGYLEMVLGENRSKNQMHIRTSIDSKTGALLVRNPFNTDFPDRVAFFDVNGTNRSMSGDRMEFIGRNGSLCDPAALHRIRLSGTVGAGLDPAAILQVYTELEPGQEKEIIFFLGAGRSLDESRDLIQRFQGTQAAHEALDRVWQYWNHTLGAVNIETPDPALNLIANGWLVYQTMASRLWGRSGYYQSGGAFGFRDQLQDVMSLIHTEPDLVREHILLCASRQFSAGDVQHWWHPPQGRGVRTMISDDYLWLPFVTSEYVTRTGDSGILDETIHFLQSRPLEPGEESLYDLPSITHEKGTLYEHCVRAILHALRFGEHGLPLIGSGDWNDGMNLVGTGGRGESVWLAFFLHAVLKQFGPLAKTRGDHEFFALCKEEARRLQHNIESESWDGQWYQRAFCDDGTILGSSQSEECKIDAIAQSWSVLSGAGSPERTKQAMDSLARELIDQHNSLIRLLDPPFDTSPIEPGYIKGYVPGIRENGGQYTHAAIWAVMAFAKMGNASQVEALLPMINPVNHGSTRKNIQKYMVEPYVMAADIYGKKPHTGRGGWTWYTGSAAWMYRLVIESVLGFQLKANVLTFNPCVSTAWKDFTVHYRFCETVYHCVFHQNVPGGRICVTVDGVKQEDQSVHLVNDQREHAAEITIGIDKE